MSGQQKTIEIINEVVRIYREEEDVHAAKRIVKAVKESEQICAEKEAKMKAAINELIATVNKKRSETAVSPAVEVLKEREQVISAKDLADKEYRDLLQQYEACKSEERELSKKEEELNQQLEMEKESLKKKVPSLVSAFRMYQTISMIQWDYEDMSNVKGSLHNVEQKKIEPFCISKSQGKSGYEVANELWDMIGLTVCGGEGDKEN